MSNDVNNNEGCLTYRYVSPYSGFLLKIDLQTNFTKTVEPLEFRPTYAEPLKEGQAVPY